MADVDEYLKVIQEYDTTLCSDSIEWCPVEGMQDFFVCGNYQLEEDKSQGSSDEPRKRFGRILLFKNTETPLKPIQIIETPAILDLKWGPDTSGMALLGAATAKSSIILFQLSPNDKALNQLTSFVFPSRDDGKEQLILSLDWCKYYSKDLRIICSDSLGSLHLFEFNNNSLQLIQSWNDLHSQSAWISAFNYCNPNIFYSGGDDCVFIKVDSRDSSMVKSSKVHESGVTSIHKNKVSEYLVATGSYDGYIRLFDERSLKSPLKSYSVDHPIWRVKWDPFKCKFLLCACMQGGLNILQLDDDYQKMVGHFPDEQEGITYGADWCHDPSSQFVGSCTFYSHKLYVLCYNTLF